MANARLLLTGGPFDGHEAAGLPPNVQPPAQIVWSGWGPHGFTSWLYEWRGESTAGAPIIDALIYRPTGRQLAADEIPPLIAEDVDLWADTTCRLVEALHFHPGLFWPGV